MAEHMGKRVYSSPMTVKKHGIVELVDNYFTAYNAARLREACQIFSQKLTDPTVTVGCTLTGALTPAGIGGSIIVPLIENGLIDWIVATGANLYHDLHYALDKAIYQSGRPGGSHDDVLLREKHVVRVYDLLFDSDVLFDTDRWVLEISKKPEFQHTMATSKYHNLIGKYVDAVEKELKTDRQSILAAAYRHGVPVYTSSPGDSTFGLNIAALQLQGYKCNFDAPRDVNETAAIVYNAKVTEKGKSAIVIFGGGSPKNFALQTEPHIQEILKLPEAGHDYFLQFTDARPDTGGLSGATPQEAVSWGKIDPLQLPDTVVCYLDSTVVLPILCAYLFEKGLKKPHKKLFDKLDKLLDVMKNDYLKSL